MTHFSANLNKIALLRNTRDTGIPDLLRAARLCIQAGAAGITVHPRPDQRHTRTADVHQLRGLTAEAGVEFNVEGYPDDGFLALVCASRPDQCTLVPDAPQQRTSDHGWDVAAHRDLLARTCDRLRRAGIRVSIFVDPDEQQARDAGQVGAHRIELYTEPYAHAFVSGDATTWLPRYAATARAATAVGLGVNAGHDLNLHNLGIFLHEVPAVAEVSIGHALIADALELGMVEAVRRYVAICQGGTPAAGH